MGRKFTAVKSTGTLEARPVSELLQLYRDLVPGDPPDFKDKAALVRACIIELAKRAKPKRHRHVEALPALEPKDRKPWFFDPTMLEPKIPRKGSKRETIVNMMRTGATFAEIQEACGWTYRQACAQVRHTNTQNGYGIFERNKRLYAYTYEEGPPE